MSLPRLPLEASTDRLPGIAAFPGEGPVLWLGSAAPLAPLRAELEAAGRLWTADVSAVAVPGPPPGTNPFSHRPDRHAPLRWGPPGDDRRTLDEIGAPEAFDGAVFAAVLGGLGAQAARTLLTQVAGRLASGVPWLLVDRNGRYLPEVVRNLRRSEDERGEGRGTVRTVEELRRLLEPPGFGVGRARGLAPRRRDRAAMRLFGADGAAMWLVVSGERI
jgi:hypothetical protein